MLKYLPHYFALIERKISVMHKRVVIIVNF